MSFLSARIDSSQFTLSVWLQEISRNYVKCLAIASILIEIKDRKDCLQHALQHPVSGNCNGLPSLMKLYEFDHVLCCHINACIIRESMVGIMIFSPFESTCYLVSSSSLILIVISSYLHGILSLLRVVQNGCGISGPDIWNPLALLGDKQVLVVLNSASPKVNA